MDRLDREDLARVLGVVSAVNRVQDRDGFFRCALAAVVEVVPCLVASINEVDPLNGRFNYWMDPAGFPLVEGALEIFTELVPTHPLVAHYERTGDGSARRVSDVQTAQQFHDSRLYQEFYGPMGIDYQVAFVFPAPRPTVLAMALSRADRDFSEHDKLMLDALRPYLAQAWRAAGDQERLRALAAASDRRLRLSSLALTAREAEVVRLVTLGQPNGSIARQLNISPGTVKKHLDNVYEKLGVHGRGALTAFVLEIA